MKFEFFKTKEEISMWLDSHQIKNYTIHDNLIVDVDGAVSLVKKQLTHIPVQFGEVKGIFHVGFNQLKSLKGSPKIVALDFFCQNNQLINLRYCPENIDRTLNCSNNKIENLDFFPTKIEKDIILYNNQLKHLKNIQKKVNGIFDCSNNQLMSLKNGPTIAHKSFNCSNNKLENLLGSPEIVMDWFNCSQNNLTTLLGAPEIVAGDFNCSINQLTSLEHLTPSISDLLCKYNQIESLKGLKNAEEVYMIENPLKNITPDDLRNMSICTIALSPDCFLESYLKSSHFKSVETRLNNIGVSFQIFKEMIAMNHEIFLLEKATLNSTSETQEKKKQKI